MVQAQESWIIIVHLAHDALFERPRLCSGVERCQPCGAWSGMAFNRPCIQSIHDMFLTQKACSCDAFLQVNFLIGEITIRVMLLDILCNRI